MSEDVDVEDRIVEAVPDDHEEEGAPFLDLFIVDEETAADMQDEHEDEEAPNQAAIDGFLGQGSRTYEAGILPGYYGELLTWALDQYLQRNGWKVAGALGYHGPEPVYTEVNTGAETLNLIMDGQMLVEKGDDRYIVTVELNPRWRASVQIGGPAEKKENMVQLIADVMAIAGDENFYRGKNIEFAGQIRLLEVKGRAWDSIVLDRETKEEIKANTVGFLKQSKRWSRYGIPLKRGVLLAGEPGTGKTVVCKALMAEAEGITCIATNGYALGDDGYITELYDLAEDLRPCIVFIEDIDLIGQSRMEFGYQRGPALLALLAVLDGLEEQREIVTVATTNCLETLDKALSERPSRFDRIIRLSRPSLEQRRELIGRLCRKIPLDDEPREYLAARAEHCTPAQMQEVVFSLVIQSPPEHAAPIFSRGDIDRAIATVNDRNRHRLGFASEDRHQGNKPLQIAGKGGRK